MLRGLLSMPEWAESPKFQKMCGSVLAKLDKAEAPADVSIAEFDGVGAIEKALISKASGKVVQLSGGYGQAHGMAKACKATVADAEVLGGWLSRQNWMNEPTTLIGVLRKWNEWLPRARATQPPPSLEAGFGDTGQGTKTPSGKAPVGRKPSGFR